MMTPTKLMLKAVLDASCCLLEYTRFWQYTLIYLSENWQVYVPWIVLETIDIPFERGFFCNDESIRHPYHDTTISATIVICLGILFNILAFLVIEGVYKFVYHETKGKKLCIKHGLSEVIVHPYIVDCYRLIGVFLFGAAAEASIVNIMKYSIGRLRPHFIDVCKPNWGSFNCTTEQGHPRYVTDAVCTGTDEVRIIEGRISFPSGHSSMAFYFAVFLVVYIQARVTIKFSKLLKYLLQVIVLYAALAVALSRIYDYKHFWSDVFVGGLVGTITAYLLARYCCGLYKHLDTRKVYNDIVRFKEEYGDYGTYQSGYQPEYSASKRSVRSQYDNIAGSSLDRPKDSSNI